MKTEEEAGKKPSVNKGSKQERSCGKEEKEKRRGKKGRKKERKRRRSR